MSVELPNPQWHAAPSACVGCGYALHDLGGRCTCPECGMSFDQATIVLYGVPRSTSPGSPVRRVLWTIVVIFNILVFQFAGILMLISGYFMMACIVAGIAGLVAMIVTSKREAKGVEKYLLTSTHFIRAYSDLGKKPARAQAAQDLDPISYPLATLSGFQLDRVSSVWYRLRLGTLTPTGVLTGVVLDTGLRCPDADALKLRQELSQRLQATRPQAVSSEAPAS